MGGRHYAERTGHSMPPSFSTWGHEFGYRPGGRAAPAIFDRVPIDFGIPVDYPLRRGAAPSAPAEARSAGSTRAAPACRAPERRRRAGACRLRQGGTEADRDRRQHRSLAASTPTISSAAHDARRPGRPSSGRRLGEASGDSPSRRRWPCSRTADENMANAIRLIAVERGLDTRDFALIAFGGAGPLHGRAVAERLGMSTVIVPPHPGLCSAFGAAIAEARVDRSQTHFTNSEDIDLAGGRRVRAAAGCDGRRTASERRRPNRGSHLRRYALFGPELQVEVPLPSGGSRRARRGRDADRALRRGPCAALRIRSAGRARRADQLRVTAISPEPTATFTSPGAGASGCDRPPGVVRR